MTIAEFFAKGKRNIIEELEGDAQKDIELLKQIIDLHSKKLKKIKELDEIWETGKKIRKLDSIFQEIKNINESLSELIKRLLKLESLEVSIVKLLLAKNVRPYELEILHYIDNLLEKLEEHLNYLKDILINLKFLIDKQNAYLNEHWTGEVIKDIEEHLTFYLMLEDETSIEERLKKFVLMIESETRYLLNFVEEKPKGTISFEEVFSPDSPHFEQLYDEIFKRLFPLREDRAPIIDLRKYIKQRYEKIKDAYYHILVMKVAHTPVGAIMFDILPIDRTLCAGAVYYYFLDEELLANAERGNEGSRMLYDTAMSILTRDAQTLRFGSFAGLIAEIEDVNGTNKLHEAYKLKSGKQLKIMLRRYTPDEKEKMEKSVRGYSVNGFRKADFLYIVPGVDNIKANVGYYMFCLRPDIPEWSKQGIPKDVFLRIFTAYVDQAYEIRDDDGRPDLYELMKADIESRKFIRLVRPY